MILLYYSSFLTPQKLKTTQIYVLSLEYHRLQWAVVLAFSYVVDSGREKKRVFSSGSDCFSYFTITLTSQAAAQQRAGRAGRVGAGVCYRLYSSAVFAHEMEQHPLPQICSVPLDHLMLFMAALGKSRRCCRPFAMPFAQLAPHI